MSEDRLIPATFDFRNNTPKEWRSVEDEKIELVASIELNAEEMVHRGWETKTFISTEVASGLWFRLYHEAKEAYIFGLYRSVISLVGMAAECFCNILIKEYAAKNPSVARLKSKFWLEPERIHQSEKIKKLTEESLLSSEDANILNDIAGKRNDFMHYPELDATAEDALKLLNLLLELLNQRFNRRFYIGKGKIKAR